MLIAPLQPDEPERLAALCGTSILDTPEEAFFEDIVDCVVHECAVPIALVSLIDDARQWFKARHGLTVNETSRDFAFCAHAILSNETLVVSDARSDPRFDANPLVTGEPHIVSYAGAPIVTKEGYRLGTVCAIDRSPRTWTRRELDQLNRLARLTSRHIEARQAFLAAEQRHEIDRTLALSQAQYRSVTAAMAEGVVVQDAAGAILEVNAAAQNILGLSEDMMRGVTSLDPRWRAIREDGADFPGLEHPAMIALATGMPQCNIIMGVGTTSETRWLSINAHPIFDHGPSRATRVVTTFADITAYKSAVAGLQFKDRHLNLALKLARAATWELNFRDQTFTSSDTLSELFGGDVSKSATADFWSLIHEDDRADVTSAWEAHCKGGPPLHLDHRIVSAAGDVVWFNAWIVALRSPSNKITGAMGHCVDITERKRRETELAQALEAARTAHVQALGKEAHFRALTENGADVTMQSDLDGRLVYVSPSVEALSGYSPKELIGRESLGFIHPDDAIIVRAAIEATFRSRGATPLPRLESRMLHKDGRTVWVETQPNLLKDPTTGHMLGITDLIRDITRRKLAENQATLALQAASIAREAAEISEARYRLLADNSIDIIMRIAPDGTILYCSPACRQWGYEPEDLVGRNNLSFVHPEDVPVFERLVSALFHGTPLDPGTRRDYRARAKDGSYAWMEGRPKLITDPQGVPLAAVTVLRDVTLRREMEDALALAKTAAEAATDAKAEFLANISHELRTPLTSIIGYARLLEWRTDLDTKAQTFAARIAKAGATLLAMVNDLLSISQLDAEQMTLAFEPVRLDDLAQTVLDLLEDQTAAKNLAVSLSIDPQLPAIVMGDPARLQQVLLNLFANAVKFTASGGVRVVIERADREHAIRFSVVDTGIGISSEHAARLFQRFSQADVVTRQKYGGTGLGLAISKKLLDLMGGHIGVESEPDCGTTFWFIVELPAVQATLPQAQLDSSVSGKRILLIEDHLAVQKLILAILTPLGHSVDIANNGVEGLTALENQSYDLILVDAHMPVMGGVAFTRAVRALNEESSATPIIALTADTGQGLRRGFLDAGAQLCLAKPIDVAQLVAAVTDACRSVETTAATQAAAG